MDGLCSTHLGERKNVYRLLVGKPMQRPLTDGRIISVYIKEPGCEDSNWI
jgi:hypothetical protein